VNNITSYHFRYQSKFFNLIQPDCATLDWIAESKSKSADLWLQLFHIFAKLILKIFLTQTCSNGILKRGSMFILSENHFAQFLISGGFRFNNESSLTLLDVGAGKLE
jgi:DREV methyltransferase